ncbi:hypothetical protein [Leifsonia sp. NPDC058248]|uniref:hypothetical protein n=1 Tax=Leifsonia sp. NPDC058248 TaxID=3346402 RepID=UPI0036DD9C2C
MRTANHWGPEFTATASSIHSPCIHIRHVDLMVRFFVGAVALTMVLFNTGCSSAGANQTSFDSVASASAAASHAAAVSAAKAAAEAAAKVAAEVAAAEAKQDAAAKAAGMLRAGPEIYMKTIPGADCGYGACSVLALFTVRACAAGIYVEASEMAGGVSVGRRNAITAGLPENGWAKVTLRADDGTDSLTIQEAHCLG